ncbi:MAG: hypothetical protein JWO58_1233 [Chitinophagaceae bacterium]|nr:hypothetical protein [Chitinophagaceae bacterium]
MSLKYIAILFLLLSINKLTAQHFEPQSGSLHDLNQTFHDDYNQLVSYQVQRLGDSLQPVMVFTGDTLIFKYRNKREVSRIIPPVYHQLKAVDHLVLAVFVLVTPWPEGKISEEHVSTLQKHDVLCNIALDELNNYSFVDSILLRQKKLILTSRNYIRQLMKERYYRKEDRNVFARFCKQSLLDNTDEAARLEITNLHAQVSLWRKQLDDPAFHRLYVVIGSSHQARYRELTVQYFDKVLSERSDGSAQSENRLVFAESVFNEAGCLSMLARHIIDQEIGLVFFGDPYRMQRDLLSDAASKYIRLIFPEKKK